MEERKKKDYHGVGLHPLFASSICEIRMLLMVADDNNKKENGGGSGCGCWSSGGVWFVFNKELPSSGLSAACSAFTPDQKAVGQPLRRCDGSA
jgi:hypothetical protein